MRYSLSKTEWVVFLLAAVGLALMLSRCGTAHAQAVELAHDGKPGMWLPADEARKVLGKAEEADALARTVRLQTEQLTVRGEALDHAREHVKALEGALETGDGVSLRLEKSLALYAEREQDMRDRLDAWYRSPIFLVGVGVGATVLVQVAAVMLLGSVK